MDAVTTAKNKGWNVFQYAQANENMFERNMEAMGKSRKTTFFSDLSIAEWYSNKSVIDTYNQVMKSWGKNIEYLTEFCICLNHKIWQHYQDAKELATIYDNLWRSCQDYILEKFKNNEEAINYYYELTD